MAKNRFRYHTNTLMACLAILVISVLVACGTHPESIQTTSATRTILTTEATPLPTLTTKTSIPHTQNLRPGVYTTNEIDALPLPTSGYELYVVGEPHAEREAHQLVFSYLKTLYETAGMRDIILEQISPAYERDVNAYVLGHDDIVSPKWSFVADVVIDVRMFNDTLPDSEKVRFHLVDIDPDFADMYTHLQVLREELGAAAMGIDMPSLSEFRTWDEAEMLALVDQMAYVSQGRPGIISELTTVEDSIRSYVAWQRFGMKEISESEFIEQLSIREERIAQNTQNLLAKLDGAPVLALYGGWHAQKHPAMIVPLGSFSSPVFMEIQSWVQRLAESGVSIYSVLAWGISGEAKVKGSYLQQVDRDPHQMRFSDGITLGDVFDANPQHSIVYVDLRLGTNSTLRLGDDFQDVPAGEIYDGIILFREVSPVEQEKYP